MRQKNTKGVRNICHLEGWNVSDPFWAILTCYQKTINANPNRLFRSIGLLLMQFLLLVSCGVACAGDENDYDEHSIRASDVPGDAPTFEQYPEHTSYRGPIAAPDVRSNPESRMFRTMIRKGAKRGPNFAGHYTMVFWGCGARCAAVAIARIGGQVLR